MTFLFPLTGLATVLSLLVYMWMTVKVGQARAKHETPAPAMQGPDELMRVFRVHGNTLEGLVLYLPSLWIFALLWGDMAAGLVGLAYPVGRIVYALGYYAEAGKREAGFLIGLVATAILLLGALVGLVRVLLGV